jgi:hypothetical protein
MLSIIGTRAGDWLASEGREGVVLYGPYMPLAAGDYLATFELACDAPPAAHRLVATCDIACGNEGRRLASIDVAGIKSRDPFEVALPFSLAEPTDLMQFRVIAADGIPIRVRDHVVVKRNTFAKAA